MTMFENCLRDEAMRIYQGMKFVQHEFVQEIIDVLDKSGIGVTNNI